MFSTWMERGKFACFLYECNAGKFKMFLFWMPRGKVAKCFLYECNAANLLSVFCVKATRQICIIFIYERNAASAHSVFCMNAAWQTWRQRGGWCSHPDSWWRRAVGELCSLQQENVYTMYMSKCKHWFGDYITRSWYYHVHQKCLVYF